MIRGGSDQPVLAACIDICVRATMHMDHGDAPAMAELFTDDLEFVRPSTFPNVAIRGRGELLAAMAARGSDSVSRHVASNFVATRIAHDVVTVDSYFTHFRGNRTPAATPVPLADALRSIGEYRDRLAFRDGRWRIARREARFIFGGL